MKILRTTGLYYCAFSSFCFCFCLVAFFAADSVSAADGSSGCGPGWYVLRENSLLSSVLRATTNGVLFPTTTFGMSSGTSNCSKHNIVKQEKESLYFVVNNYYELKTESSMGRGEFLAALVETLGCDGAGQDLFNAEIKKNYGKIFRHHHEKADKVLEEIYQMIFSHEQLTKWCMSIS